MAVKISEELQEEILEWEKSYHRLPVRWLTGKNLHITLISPWESEDAERTKAALKTLEGKVGPFEMVFEKVEFGPHGQELRLIWAEGAAPKEMIVLKNELEKLLGLENNGRSFRLHLTLARFHPKDFVRFPVKKLDEKVFWRQKVKSFVLIESRLLPDGADYEVLEEVIL